MVKIDLADLKKMSQALLKDPTNNKAHTEFRIQFNPILVAHLLDDLEYALKLLKEGKTKFAPHTTNSNVDDFLKKYEVKG